MALIRALLGTALFLCAGGCADAVLLFPSTEPINPPGEHREFIQSGYRKLEMIVTRTPSAIDERSAGAFVLDFCGNATRAEETAARDQSLWANRPVEIWAMNYAGFGQSDGPTSLMSIPPDSLTANDEISRRAAGRPVFVRGFSLGTTAALHVAAHRRVAGLILQSPPPLQREIMEHDGWWNLWLLAVPITLQVPRDMNSLCSGPNAHAPAIFILTARDGIVPIRYQQMVVDNYAGEKRVLLRPDADHNDRLSSGEIAGLQSDLDWLWSNAGSASVH